MKMFTFLSCQRRRILQCLVLQCLRFSSCRENVYNHAFYSLNIRPCYLCCQTGLISDYTCAFLRNRSCTILFVMFEIRLLCCTSDYHTLCTNGQKIMHRKGTSTACYHFGHKFNQKLSALNYSDRIFFLCKREVSLSYCRNIVFIWVGHAMLRRFVESQNVLKNEEQRGTH